MHYHSVRRLVVLTLLAVAAPLAAQAQVTITSPTAGQRLKAGPDFATNVLADPMDMSNPEDISPDPLELPGWVSLTFAGGRLTGQTAPSGGAPDSAVTFLYRGFYGLVNPGRNGMKFPIDPNVYRKLSFKMNAGASTEQVQVYWFHNPLGDPAGIGDGVNVLPGLTTNGERIYTVDLGAATTGGTPWLSSIVRGFRIDPNNTTTGQTVSFDWVRLTTGDSHPSAAIHNITWSGGTGTTNIDVIDAGGTTLRIATGVSGTSFAWNYGVLPPGSYTLRVTRGTSPAVTRAFSINNPPVVRVLDPDDKGGADFATDVLGNPWDMQQASDVVAVTNVTNVSFSGGFINGTSNTTGDPGVWLLNQVNNSTPIDSKKYRYLSFDLEVAPPYDLGLGSVARVFWGSQANSVAGNMTTTKDIIVFPGLNHYTIDLASLSPTATGGLEPSGAAQAWTTAPITFLRIDPHEFPEARNFRLGNVRLAAVDEASPVFTLQWGGVLPGGTAADADGDPATVSLFYDTNTDPADGMTAIASNLAIGTGSFQWNAASVPTGQ